MLGNTCNIHNDPVVSQWGSFGLASVMPPGLPRLSRDIHLVWRWDNKHLECSELVVRSLLLCKEAAAKALSSTSSSHIYICYSFWIYIYIIVTCSWSISLSSTTTIEVHSVRQPPILLWYAGSSGTCQVLVITAADTGHQQQQQQQRQH